MPTADELLGTDVAEVLVDAIRAAAPATPLRALPQAARSLDGLALRERSDLLRDALLTDVPGDYAELARVVRAARDGALPFEGWLIWPVTSAVATRAVENDTDEAFDDAMQLLADLTGRLTSEFSVRTLLRHDLDRALAIALRWTASEDEHVRRLASEGTRPYLPWGMRVPQLTARPDATVPILDALYRDDSEYVRRSVANHLNDISRDRPELVVAVAGRWLADPDGTTPALVRRALRTLVKQGHPEALGLLGFGPAPVDVDGPRIDRASVPFGGTVQFTATIRNRGTEDARLAIDYVVHHQKANGSQTTKTFKLATRTLTPGEHLVVDRAHSFRAISTRRYYPGPHAVALQVNGVVTAAVPFVLEAPTVDDAG